MERCHLHEANDAIALCDACGKSICNLCLVEEQLTAMCRACIGERRKKRLRKRAVVMASLSAVMVLGFVAFVLGPMFLSHREESKGVAVLEARLAEAPCEKGFAVQLADARLRAGETRALLDGADDFYRRCGVTVPRLAFLTYGTRMQRSDFDGAIRDGTVLIASEPRNSRYRNWRGLAYESRGDLEAAAADYRSSLAIQPRGDADIPLNLADIYEKQGHPCDALFVLEQLLRHNPKLASDGTLQARIERLYRTGGCDKLAGAGQAVIHFAPGDPTIETSVLVNGTQRANFVVDTGASYVALSRGFADRLGLPRSTGRTVTVATAAGMREVQLATVEKIEVQGVSAGQVTVTISDDLPFDGLLGLSFLGRFSMKLDQAAGTLEIAAQPPKR